MHIRKSVIGVVLGLVCCTTMANGNPFVYAADDKNSGSKDGIYITVNDIWLKDDNIVKSIKRSEPTFYKLGDICIYYGLTTKEMNSTELGEGFTIDADHHYVIWGDVIDEYDIEDGDHNIGFVYKYDPELYQEAKAKYGEDKTPWLDDAYKQEIQEDLQKEQKRVAKEIENKSGSENSDSKGTKNSGSSASDTDDISGSKSSGQSSSGADDISGSKGTKNSSSGSSSSGSSGTKGTASGADDISGSKGTKSSSSSNSSGSSSGGSSDTKGTPSGADDISGSKGTKSSSSGNSSGSSSGGSSGTKGTPSGADDISKGTKSSSSSNSSDNSSGNSSDNSSGTKSTASTVSGADNVSGSKKTDSSSSDTANENDINGNDKASGNAEKNDEPQPANKTDNATVVISGGSSTEIENDFIAGSSSSAGKNAPKTTGKSSSGTTAKAPKTGDKIFVALMAFAAGIIIAFIGIVFSARKRKRY